jgi:hypothetical protein
VRAFEHTQINLFLLLEWIGTFAGLSVGLALGLKHLGLLGAGAGAVLGLLLGNSLGRLPDWWAFRYFFKEIEQSSDSTLREMISQGEWKMWHTMALLQLAARGHDVKPEFPRILAMLGSDAVLTRRYGFDALRLVYTELFNKVPNYNPRESTETCRQRIAALRDEGARAATSPTQEPS